MQKIFTPQQSHPSSEDKDCSEAAGGLRGEDCRLPPLRDKQQEERQLRTCEHWQYGRDSSLVRHAISENSQCTRRKNHVHHYHWPQEGGVDLYMESTNTRVNTVQSNLDYPDSSGPR